MGAQDPFVFPYRMVFERNDGEIETLDPEFLPLPVDPNPAMRLTFSEMAGTWRIERMEDEAEFAFTESAFAADPSRRMGTIFLREAGSD